MRIRTDLNVPACLCVLDHGRELSAHLVDGVLDPESASTAPCFGRLFHTRDGWLGDDGRLYGSPQQWAWALAERLPRLVERGIYELDGKRYIACGAGAGHHVLYSETEWLTGDMAGLAVDPYGRIRHQGRLTGWVISDLRFTGSTADCAEEVVR